jgi:hypothetical protein
VVLRNDSSPLKKWVAEEVNVYEDYKRLFDHEPEPVQAIAIMSDANNTRSRAVADYDDICIGKTSRSVQHKIESPGTTGREAPGATEKEPVEASPDG